MDNDLRREIIETSPISFSGLRKLNIGAGIFLGIQGILMVALGLMLDWKQELYTFYLKFKIISLAPPSFQILPDPQVAFTVTNLGVILSSFLFISAIALLAIAFIKNKSYVENLKKGMNPYRWYEYFFSSSIMLVIIATFVGVWDIWSLVMIFVLNATMIMCGLFDGKDQLLHQKNRLVSISSRMFSGLYSMACFSSLLYCSFRID